MPTVEKVTGGRVYVRDIGQFDVGDTADVSADEAAYLVDERGDFAVVEEDDVQTTEDLEDAAEEADGVTTDDGEVSVEDVCGAELSDGGTCDRPADECHYHGDDAED